jgi:NADH dehydrogenase
MRKRSGKMVLRRSFKQRVIVIGGGYAGVCCIVELVKQLRRNSIEDKLEIILVDPNDYMQTLSEFDLVAATSASRNAEFCKLRYADLFRKVPWGSFHHLRNRVVKLDPERKTVTLDDHQELEYWKVVIATGAQPFLPPIPGLAKHAIPVWSIRNISDIHARIGERMETALHEPDTAKRRALLSYTVIGAGDTGVEVMGTFGAKLPRVAQRFGLDPAELTLTLVEGSEEVLRSMPPELRTKATAHLEEDLGIRIMTGARVEKIAVDHIVVAGRKIPSAVTVWAGGVRAVGAPAGTGFETDRMNRIVTTGFLRSVDDEDVYVIGDAASVKWPERDGTLYMVAQFAVPEGPHAARNIIAEYLGKRITEFVPNHRGEFVSVGDYCVGTAFGHSVSGLPAMLIKRFTYVEYWWQSGGTWLAFRRILRMLQLMYGR